MKTTPLIEACEKNASALLKEFSEFYPFAFGLTSAGTIISVNAGMPDQDDFPSVEKVLYELKYALNKSSKDNNFHEVCICINTEVKPPFSNTHSDALQILINFKEFAPMNYFIPYVLRGNNLEFGGHFYEDGSEFMIW